MNSEQYKQKLIELLAGYLDGAVDFLVLLDWVNEDYSSEVPLVEFARSAVRHVFEDEEVYRTPTEELRYLYACLVGKDVFAQEKIDEIESRYYKSLKNNDIKYKVEVSFPDDFGGNEAREHVLTPQYILREMKKKEISLKIGDKILLYDTQEPDTYLCSIGTVVVAPFDLRIKYPDYVAKCPDLAQIDGNNIIIDYTHELFNLDLDDSLFKSCL